MFEDDETEGTVELPPVTDQDTPELVGARIKTSVEYGLTVLDAAYDIEYIPGNVTLRGSAWS